MEKRCYGCMQLKTQTPLCEHCGYNEYIDNLPHQLPLGTVLQGRYEVGKVLGQGGFGITYIGWDRELETAVAIKEFFPNGTVTRECTQSLNVINTTGGAEENLRRSKDRFIKEAQILSKLGDVAQIVHVYNLFEENETAYIVMEYIKGIDLRRYTQMVGGRLGAEQALAILLPVMEALEKVHETGLVHRDISPDNIMLMPDGTAKLLDFGAVREVMDADVNKNLSRSTEAILKHGFAPMEQYQRQGNLGPWTDVYALCATLFYCTTGSVPPDAPNRIMDDVEVPWEMIQGLDQKQIEILQQGMALKAKDRISSIRQLREGLLANMAKKKEEDTPPPPPPPPPKWPKIVAAAAVVAVIAGAVFLMGGRDSGGSGSSIGTKAPAKTNTPNEAVAVDSAISETPGEVHDLQDGSSMELYYDGQDNERLRIIYDENGTVLYKSLAEYDSEGNVLRHEIQDGSGKTLRTDSYTRNADGKVLERVIHDENGKLWEKLVNAFDSDGNITSSKAYDGKNKVRRESTYTYDSKGNKKRDYTEYADGSKNEETYTNDGKKGAYTSWDKFGNIEYRTDYVYDEDGNITERINYNGNAISGNAVLERDAEGKLLREVVYDVNGVQNSEYKYTYDGHGNQLYYSYTSTYYNATTQYVDSIIGTSLRTLSLEDNGELAVTYYNALGQIQARYAHDASGNETESTEYRYDASGTLLGHNTVYYYENGNRTEYEYDEDYNLLSSISYDGSGAVTERRIPEYNDKGQEVATKAYRADGSLSYEQEYKYNDQGLQIGRKYISYNEDGAVSYVSEDEFDEDGTFKGSTGTSYSSDGSYSIYTYDEKNATKTYTRYTSGGVVEDFTRYEHEYDSRGNEIMETGYDENGKVKSIYKTFYDEKNVRTGSESTHYYDDGSYYVSTSNADYDTISMKSYDANGRVTDETNYEYEYDANGNKIKQTAYDANGKRKYWTEYFYDEYGNYLDSEWHYN